MGQPAKRQSLPHSGSRRDRLRTNAVLHSSPIRSGSLNIWPLAKRKYASRTCPPPVRLRSNCLFQTCYPRRRVTKILQIAGGTPLSAV